MVLKEERVYFDSLEEPLFRDFAEIFGAYAADGAFIGRGIAFVNITARDAFPFFHVISLCKNINLS